jgi:hypothetical protein
VNVLNDSLNEYLNGEATCDNNNGHSSSTSSSSISVEAEPPAPKSPPTEDTNNSACMNSTDEDIDIIAQEDTLLKRILTRVNQPHHGNHSGNDEELFEYQLVDELSSSPRKEIDIELELLHSTPKAIHHAPSKIQTPYFKEFKLYIH